jgi:hypothetical protein
LSLDDAYLDVTENLKAISSATQIAEEIRARIRAETELSFGRRLLQQVHGMTPDILFGARHVGPLSLQRCRPTPHWRPVRLSPFAMSPKSSLGPVGGALVQRFGPRQAHVAFRRIRRRAGSELLTGGAALMLAASAIAIGLSRSALNFDPAKTQVRR